MLEFSFGLIVGALIYDLIISSFMSAKKKQIIQAFENAIKDNDLILKREDVLKFIEELKK